MAYNNGQRNIWAAAVAPWMVKFGLRQSGSVAPDSAESNNHQHTADNAAGTAAVNWVIPADGSNLTQLNNPNGTVVTSLTSTGISAEGATSQSSASATGITLTAANMLNAIFVRTGAGAAQTDTSPTAAALVAAAPGIQANTAIYWVYRNGSSNSVTFAAGSGVTLAAGNTNTIASNNARTFLVVFTNVTAGTEAVTIYSIGASAF